MYRALGQVFEFGEQHEYINRRGREVIKGDYRVKPLCPWSVTGPDGFHLTDLDFPYGQPRTDSHALPFYSLADDQVLQVQKISVDKTAVITIALTQGYTITVHTPSQNPVEEEEFAIDIHSNKPSYTDWYVFPPDLTETDLIQPAQAQSVILQTIEYDRHQGLLYSQRLEKERSKATP